MTVVRSHYKRGPATRERIYATGNGIAEWLGLGSWIDIPQMQMPENKERFREMIARAR